MTAEMNTALVLLVVGMLTVFVILGLVVLTGQVLIRIVNRFAPAAAPIISSARRQASRVATEGIRNQQSTLAAIIAAVEVWGGGKASIQSIEQIEEED